jgi:hypothetical protein
MMNWKDRALHAAANSESIEREEQRRRDEVKLAKQVEEFRIALGKLLEEDIAVDALEVTVDGVTFGWVHFPMAMKYGIVLQGTCAECRVATWSQHIKTLKEVGQLLQRFSPSPYHEHTHTTV